MSRSRFTYRSRKYYYISSSSRKFTSLFFPLKKNYPKFSEFSIINPILISDIIKFFCNKKSINLKFPNDIMIDNKKICGLLQELITLNNKQFLIIGIGINLISSPDLQNDYKTTNILSETNKKVDKKEMINLIVSSYEDFFKNIKSYKYINYKQKADLLAL